MAKLKDIAGQKFGRITVLEVHGKDRWHKILWKCVCECGTIIIKTKSDLTTKMQSCGCLQAEKASAYHWRGYEDISKSYWSHVERAARDRNIKLEISMKQVWELYIEQNKKCALTGIDIGFSRSYKKGRKSYKEQTASLDRIDPNLGYVEGNIQLVHKTVNLCKHVLSNEEFIKLCRLVAEHDLS